MLHFVKTHANNKILKELIYTNCLSFGRNPKLNNKKINHYIFGTRQQLDIFKLYEMRYLLLRIYPLIHNLFLQARLNQAKKKKWFFDKKFDFQTKNLPKAFRNLRNFQDLKDKFNRTFKEKTPRELLPKILFATTTEMYSEILSSAAKKCRMPFHVNRWLSGAVTASSFQRTDEKRWSFLTNSFEETFANTTAQNKFFKHKKNFEVQKNKSLKYQFLRKPTLIIIPDISNNEMILKETNSLGIPALGLVNSHCNVEVSYPIFANDFSLYSVHFFCHFLSSLILKEFIKYKKNIYISRKNIRNLQFLQANKDVFRFNKRIFFKKVWSVKNDIRKTYQKEIDIQNEKQKKFTKKEIQDFKADIKKSYQEKISTLQNFVKSYFQRKAYKKRLEPVSKNYFKGKYFVEHFSKARRQIKRNINNQRSKNQKFQWDFKKKFTLRMVSPKKLIALENWKRLKKNQNNFYLRKRVLKKINLIRKLRYYNFPKIIKEIRLPENKPNFRYWNKRKFWFASPVKFASSLSLWYTFKRFKLRKLLRNKTWKAKRKQREEQNVVWKKNKSLLRKEKYRKRWSTKKVIKGNIK